ncbi:hypothetical protein RKD38_002003 [Streptomyces ambofaciens]
MTNDADAVLDDPVGQSLGGRHVHLARRLGGSATYLPGVATFSSVSPGPGAKDWADLAELLGPGAFADMFSCPALPPSDWEPVFSLEGRQMIWPDDGLPEPPGSGADARVVELDADSVPEMLDLVARTEPGPFWPRTRELGTYLGLRVDGTLVAMAGERLRPPGWTEISAVCTAPEARGQGTRGPSRRCPRRPHPGSRRAALPARGRDQRRCDRAVRAARLQDPQAGDLPGLPHPLTASAARSPALRSIGALPGYGHPARGTRRS